MVTSSDEHAIDKAAKESTQNQRLSSYTEDEKNEIKQDLSQNLEADDKEELQTTSPTVLKD